VGITQFKEPSSKPRPKDTVDGLFGDRCCICFDQKYYNQASPPTKIVKPIECRVLNYLPRQPWFLSLYCEDHIIDGNKPSYFNQIFITEEELQRIRSRHLAYLLQTAANGCLTYGASRDDLHGWIDEIFVEQVMKA